MGWGRAALLIDSLTSKSASHDEMLAAKHGDLASLDPPSMAFPELAGWPSLCQRFRRHWTDLLVPFPLSPPRDLRGGDVKG